MHGDLSARPYALVTGASSGISRELARCCARNAFDLLVATDEEDADEAFAGDLRGYGVVVDAVRADFSTAEGVQRLVAATHGRPVEVLVAHAGHGLGPAFLEQTLQEVRQMIDTHLSGTLHLIHQVGIDMRGRGHGRILITGSIARDLPGCLQGAYDGTEAFIEAFSRAMRNELEPSGVTVTCLLPGATDTLLVERTDTLDKRMDRQAGDDSQEVARIGFEAMMQGASDALGVGRSGKWVPPR